MPGVDGFELLREIRRPWTGGSVPVIAVTALVAQAARTRILNAGFQVYLPKPFNPNRPVGDDSNRAQRLRAVSSVTIYPESWSGVRAHPLFFQCFR
jgi:CheY-like chemotaxis protein